MLPVGHHGSVRQTTAVLVIVVVGSVFALDAYRQRVPGERLTASIRRSRDTDRWSWWAPAVASAGFVLLAAANVADGRWWGLPVLVPAAAMARIALLRGKGLPTRRR